MATTTDTRATEHAARSRNRSVALPSIIVGIGLGGLFDGIVLHQILQWHHVLTSTDAYPATTVRGLEVNTLWDGLFHALCYVLLAAGVFLLWSRAREGGFVRTWRSVLGWMLAGWGVFNVVEGVVDHHILRIHHVRSGPDELVYDLAFLGSGVVLFVAGWLIARSDGMAPGESLGRSDERNGRRGR